MGKRTIVKRFNLTHTICLALAIVYGLEMSPANAASAKNFELTVGTWSGNISYQESGHAVELSNLAVGAQLGLKFMFGSGRLQLHALGDYSLLKTGTPPIGSTRSSAGATLRLIGTHQKWFFSLRAGGEFYASQTTSKDYGVESILTMQGGIVMGYTLNSGSQIELAFTLAPITFDSILENSFIGVSLAIPLNAPRKFGSLWIFGDYRRGGYVTELADWTSRITMTEIWGGLRMSIF